MEGSNEETDIKNRLTDTGRGEETVRCMERVTWKLTLLYVKQIVNGNLLYVLGNSNALCINLEGWDGKRNGSDVQEGVEIYITMGDLH